MGGEGPVWTTKYMLQHISDALHNSPGDEMRYSTFLIFCKTRRETKFATVFCFAQLAGEEMCYSTFLIFCTTRRETKFATVVFLWPTRRETKCATARF